MASYNNKPLPPLPASSFSRNGDQLQKRNQDLWDQLLARDQRIVQLEQELNYYRQWVLSQRNLTAEMFRTVSTAFEKYEQSGLTAPLPEGSTRGSGEPKNGDKLDFGG